MLFGDCDVLVIVFNSKLRDFSQGESAVRALM
ncbi:hypothetical protein SA2149_03120 [Aggregatibacter actinomycetemcomitans serotype e str. SA2149]|nr:hypothetical protein CF65_01128 [Aggregatibacter actinomycetemcomitans HK1651]KYK76096.1 hypothetical protein SA2149_03120 [Aggregatibacter actinomycetemcomitans serotype e str. SA2149]KYK78158.1 hypothetical protein SC383S_09515 [Aggregatibacter actinomycetemcomitans SC383s]